MAKSRHHTTTDRDGAAAWRDAPLSMRCAVLGASQGRLVRDAAEVAKRRRLALESLGQLQEYVGAARRGVDASVYLRGGLQSGE